MKRCSHCNAQIPAGAALCPNCSATVEASSPTRFGSPMADGWIGGIVSFLGSLALVGVGLLLADTSPWLLIGSYVLALGVAIAVLVRTWKKYPALRIGLLIGFGLALLNPLTLSLEIIGIVTMSAPDPPAR